MGDKEKFIHKRKGPDHLPPEDIADIVKSRGIPKARDILAKKYGISTTRVLTIWDMYYGGTTLADFKTGLKRELPTEPIKTDTLTKRTLRTERNNYSVVPPKSVELEIGGRAKPRRVRIMNPTEQDQEIIEGEIGAGNNNPALIEAMNKMAEATERSTKNALKTTKIAKKIIKNDPDNIYSDTSDYDNILSEDTSDNSCAKYKSSAPTNLRIPKGSRNNEETETDESTYEEPKRKGRKPRNSGISAAKTSKCNGEHGIRSDQFNEPNANDYEFDDRIAGGGDRNPRLQSRAEPVFRLHDGPEQPGINRSEKEHAIISAAVPNVQPSRQITRIASAGNVQSHYESNAPQNYSRPFEGRGVSGSSGTGLVGNSQETNGTGTEHARPSFKRPI